MNAIPDMAKSILRTSAANPAMRTLGAASAVGAGAHYGSSSLAESSEATWAHPLLTFLLQIAAFLSRTFQSLPGSAILMRYIRSSYQNDPVRSLLELLLLAFAVRTVLQSRTRSNVSGSNFVKLTEEEIEDLVADFTPEPLCAPLSEAEKAELASVPLIAGANSARPRVALPLSMGGSAEVGGKTLQVLNLASYNFTDLAGQDIVKQRAIETLREYGVGSCSPPGFYGTIDVHMKLEADLARFLGTERAIIYAQGFSTVSSVIPAFCKRGDIIVADRGVNYGIQKGIQISRCNVRWYDHNSMSSLEKVLQGITREDKRRKGPLTRRFIITEGIFEHDGQMTDLIKVMELKRRHKFRLILDESLSFGTVGKMGRGMTELCGTPASEVDILVGSMASTLGSSGGFVAGSEVVEFHQRINSAAFVFSAALPALLAVASTTAIECLQSNSGVMDVLQANIKALRSVLDTVECISIPSHSPSPIIHIQVRSINDPHPQTPADKLPPSHIARVNDEKGGGAAGLLAPPVAAGVAALARQAASTHDLPKEEQTRLLQAIVDDALLNGVLLVRQKRLPSIQPKILEIGPDARPSIRIAVSTAFTKKEIEKAANVIRASCIKVLGKR
ncbi:PLP-dependent transferase [Tilletiaria anomala UBC 951]|uniref:serine C-palmitoyltransferase n=1 Tax=Tilletiaria anomala (strain ATCC 24038 / CBS 436.72 / UBC 951) TaxID=1037660 RepID=A0A066WL16_TILAU|nr:PLP-dependent transferase [Tilletiaria anomala UBC 951]KDN53268.1 PLP-dependent transferase [Tilletiaria anomala UBC 951]